MKNKDAVKYYRGREGYNCAQSILKAYQEDLDITDEQIDEYKKFGGGRAEGGICGAIYATKVLVGNKEVSDLVQQSFDSASGAVTCKEIRKLKQLSCNGCVETASQLLCDHFDGTKQSP